MAETKTCTNCKQTKPLFEFRKRSGKAARKNGRAGTPYSHCRDCERSLQDNTPGHYYRRIISAVQSRAKRSQTLCDLTAQQLAILEAQQDWRCALTGVSLTHYARRGIWPTNASIDRIEPGGPYTLENVRIVCHQANMMRGSLTDSELVRWCQRILAHAQS